MDLWYIYYAARDRNSHGNKGGPIAKGTHNDEGETGEHRGKSRKGKRGADSVQHMLHCGAE